ncbi:uncharacterized protein K441DRAFT_296726 [Cenococcum geophilum 1.58]|uniref:uncharacterized protein n=1 Tax=Cenococcum geophilum 1.58 TaxID=794803 RepID=UPI00358F6F29|nr:hypothetical protein K441DRAFT_296726 [Cenococcum geophilum 1.58]
MVHLDPSVECYGCYRIFTTYAGMIIHLESGSCDSGINILDLNESAALCYQWKHYIDEEYHDDMVEGYDLYLDYMGNYNGSVYPFKCPTCGTGFAKLSGLFQHIGSQTCDQRLRNGAIGKLINWLERQHSKRF